MVERMYTGGRRKLIPISKEILTLSDEEQVKRMTPLLLTWFQEHARILPWRENPLPYYVWISEIMLQQTRVEAVKPYFARFIKELPTIFDLSQCEDERLMKLWEGLGYYNRARNLKKAAQEVVESYGGELPADYDSLLKLSGIGSYTAGAVASIAYGIPVPAVDGNVLRVMARIRADFQDILKQSVKKQVEDLLKKTMPKDKTGDFNQAMMEIGAMICLPHGTPKCDECPLQSLCKAHMEHIETELPVKTQKKPRRVEEKTIFLIRSDGKAALKKREEKGLLSGLFELPNKEGHLNRKQAEDYLIKQGLSVLSIKELSKAKHIFSHVEWHMVGYEAECQIENDEAKEMFLEVEVIKKECAIPTAFSAYAKYI